MSREDESKVKTVFIDQIGVKYPLALIDASVTSAYGVRAFPTMFVIDAAGRVVSTGHSLPDEATLRKLLEDVSLVPDLPEGAPFDPLRRLWERKDYDRIQRYLERMLAQEDLDAELREVFAGQKAELDSKVEHALARVEKLAQGPDYHAAAEQLEDLAKRWKGLTVEERAEAELARFAKDDHIKDEMSASKKLAKLLKRHAHVGQSLTRQRKRREALLDFAKKHRETYAGNRAKELAGSG